MGYMAVSPTAVTVTAYPEFTQQGLRIHTTFRVKAATTAIRPGEHRGAAVNGLLRGRWLTRGQGLRPVLQWSVEDVSELLHTPNDTVYTDTVTTTMYTAMQARLGKRITNSPRTRHSPGLGHTAPEHDAEVDHARSPW